MSAAGHILVVCGLNREARLAAGPGIVAVAGGGHRAVLEERLHTVEASGLMSVVSFGLAGALDTALPVGAVVIPETVSDLDPASCVVAPEVRAAWLSRLDGAGLDVRQATIVGVDEAVLSTDAKAGLRRRTGGGAVDMESHVAGAFARQLGLPFGAIRVISDPAGRSLPPLAGTAMRPDGSIDVLGVVGSLARDPRQLPALVATARDAGRAFRLLRRVRGLLGPGLGLHL